LASGIIFLPILTYKFLLEAYFTFGTKDGKIVRKIKRIEGSTNLICCFRDIKVSAIEKEAVEWLSFKFLDCIV